MRDIEFLSFNLPYLPRKSYDNIHKEPSMNENHNSLLLKMIISHFLQARFLFSTRQFRFFGILSLLGAMVPIGSWAQTPVLLNDQITTLSLGKHLEILADPEGVWTLDDVRNTPLTNQFQAAQNLNFGKTDVIYWARFTLRNLQLKDSIWFLQYSHPGIDEIMFFTPNPDGKTYSQKTVGSIYPMANRDVRHPLFTFRVETPSHSEKTIYVRLDANGKIMFMSWTLWEEVEFLNYGSTYFINWYLYILVFVIAGIFTLFLFLIFRQRIYLYYALFSASSVLAFLCQKGFDDIILWSIPGQKGHYGFVLSLMGIHFFQLLFIRSFLKIPQYHPKVDYLVKGFLLIFVLLFCSIWWMPRPWQTNLNYLIDTPVVFLIFGVSVLRYRQQYKPALFMAAGSFATLVASMVITLITWGFIGDKSWIDISIATGRLTEAALFLIGLVNVYFLVLREKMDAQTEVTRLKEKMVEELTRTDQLKDEFLANTSHELKTPLHGIIGLCETMINTPESQIAKEQKEHLRLITNSAQRLSSLVGDILDFSKIKNQDLKLQIRQTELQSAIRLAEQLCLPLIGSKSVRLSTHLPQESIWVQADENRLQQILLNLLSNAIKFTHEGHIEINVHFDIDSAFIAVTDTGIGIEKKHLDQIFLPFFQADGSIAREYAGTGLGLAVTRQLVKLHQGQLQVESVPGQGSTFSFTLPLFQAEAPPETTFPQATQDAIEVSPTPQPFENPTKGHNSHQEATPLILVVDDEPLNLKVLEGYLSKVGYSVISANNGFQALDYLKDKTPDLVLLDVMMPRLNGYEVCRQIRQNYSAAQLPIIMQTAKSQVDDHIQGLQAGANDYITKPFHFEEMLARVGSQLQLRQAIELMQENQRLLREVERARQVEGSLRVSENRLSKLLDVGNEALFAVNENGNIIYYNQLFKNWLNYSSEDLDNQPVSKLIPSHLSSHPLEFSWAEMQQEAPSLFYTYTVLQNGQGGQWKGQMWQTLLELEETIYVITLASLPLGQESETPSITPNWLEELNRNRNRLQKTIDILADLHPAKLKSQPHLMKELNAIDSALEKLSQAKPKHNPEERFKQALVEVMNQTLDCWETTTQTSAIELAEKSGLWKVYTEENRVRVRVLERYLEPKRLPKNPRWRTVVRTANFVLSHCSLSIEQQSRLEIPLNRLLQLIHQRNLSSSSD